MLIMRLSLAIAALVIVGCRNLEDPAPSQETRLVVQGVLDTQSFEQPVLVYRARTGQPKAVEAAGVSDDEPVADAEVTLTAPDGTTAHAARPAKQTGECCEPGIYLLERPLGAPLIPGGTYTLRIRTPLGEEVTGSTTIPEGSPSLPLQPPHVFFRLRDTLRLSWPRVPGAASYEIIISDDRDRRVCTARLTCALRDRP